MSTLNALKLTRNRNAAVYEQSEGDDLYMVVIWQGADGWWTAEVFVNGSSITRHHDANRPTLLEKAGRTIYYEIMDRSRRSE